MIKTYSTYDAKARFSEILRDVRNGQRVLISYRGATVAEIRPVRRETDDPVALRMEELIREGVIVPAEAERDPDARFFAPVRRRRGALQRFLDERDEE